MRVILAQGLWCNADIELNMRSVPTVSRHAESESLLLSNYLFEKRKNDGKAAVPLGHTTRSARLAMHEGGQSFLLES